MVSHVGVLGAGLMGSATALLLARRGVRVTLLDAADRPCARASRWNEGKIHLGYLYAGDRSLDTARRVVPGGLSFQGITEQLVGCSLAPAISVHDDVYAIHRHSIVGADAAAAFYDAVSALAAAHPDAGRYLGGSAGARPRRLSRAELEAGYDTAQVVAAFQVRERSVVTNWIADRIVDAVAAEARVEFRPSIRVLGVRGVADRDGPLFVETERGVDGPYDAVVNALWEGRLAVDRTAGLPPPVAWSHRHRLSVFARTSQVVDLPSTVIATGPFGDVKNYNGRDVYLSWYASGLVAEGTAVDPPVVPVLAGADHERLTGEIIDRLGALVPPVGRLRPLIESSTLAGGWVYAAGQGSLADPLATLHRRDRVGVTRIGRYVSVDTGKYSIAPWLAREVTVRLLG